MTHKKRLLQLTNEENLEREERESATHDTTDYSRSPIVRCVYSTRFARSRYARNIIYKGEQNGRTFI